MAGKRYKLRFRSTKVLIMTDSIAVEAFVPKSLVLAIRLMYKIPPGIMVVQQLG